jgi:glutamate-1-semialdehyde aminotransferase/NAD(P)-dependent dehydrogenase (short-subunit alcohol dehydrogenase family)
MRAELATPPAADACSPGFPDISESNRLWERARGLIPAGTQTLAKGPGQHVDGVAPKYLRRGQGARVWDVDGNEYLDMSMGVGPLVLGYCYPAVDEAIRRQLADGITFSLMHPLEVEVAERIRALVPGAEAVRFSKTGADVTSAAVRVARAFTGRSKVVCCGYHGWHDWHIAVTDRAAGIPGPVRDLTSTFEYNDLSSLDRALDGDVACVIMEPMVFEDPERGFLEGVRERCSRNGSLLVFDEMWTGFRLAPGGAQERFAVTPDLSTFSKAVANGMPLAVLTGRADVMAVFERDAFFFTTFGGEALSLAAARATLEELVARDVTAHLAAVGGQIREGYNRIARELGMDGYTRCVGPGCRTLVTFDPRGGSALELKSLLQQELIRRGVLWSGTHAMSYAHGSAEVARLLEAYAAVLPILQRAVETKSVPAMIRGRPVEPVFRRTSHFNTRPAPAPAPAGGPAATPAPFSLADRVAVVTGAAGLLGRQHAAALAEAGAAVVLVDLDQPGLDEAAAALGDSARGGALAVATDVTNPEGLEHLRQQVLQRFGRVDVLVNNAAINDKVEASGPQRVEGRVESYSLAQWRRVLDVNVTGVFLPSKVLGEEMARRGGGSIINIASTYALVGPDQSLYVRPDGTRPFVKSPAYPASKGAVLALTRFLAAYWGRQSVRVNALVPGGVENGQEQYFVDRYGARTPLGRMAAPDEYRGAIVFLASDASRYMTGSTLVVDGGFTAW